MGDDGDSDSNIDFFRPFYFHVKETGKDEKKPEQ